jgi:CpeT protein
MPRELRNLMDMQTCATWLAGTYTNRAQAMAEPVWFIPVTLWYVLVPGLFTEGVSFFTEQVNEHEPALPYRSRVVRLQDAPLRLENYRLREQSSWAGAACDPSTLRRLTAADLIHLPNCAIDLTMQAGAFQGKMAEPKGCRLTPTSYVQIEFTLTATTFVTLDRGFDVVSGEQLWGSRAGAYRYQKISTS